MPDPTEYLRATLNPQSQRARERRNPDTPGVATVGAHVFLDGVAFVPRTGTLVQRLRSGAWVGVELADDVEAGELAEYLQRVHEIENPPPRSPSECRPGFCPWGGEHVHGCRTAFPQNFPPPPEPRPDVVYL